MVKEWNICSFEYIMMMKPIDKDALEEFEALKARVQRVILDGVKDHLISHLVEKKTSIICGMP